MSTFKRVFHSKKVPFTSIFLSLDTTNKGINESCSAEWTSSWHITMADLFINIPLYLMTKDTKTRLLSAETAIYVRFTNRKLKQIHLFSVKFSHPGVLTYKYILTDWNELELRDSQLRWTWWLLSTCLRASQCHSIIPRPLGALQAAAILSPGPVLLDLQ